MSDLILMAVGVTCEMTVNRAEASFAVLRLSPSVVLVYYVSQLLSVAAGISTG